MFFKLFLLFTILPALEMILLLRVGSIIGFPGTVSVILLTGILGAALARQQGLQTIMQIKQSMSQGEIPTISIVDGFLILVAGIVLVTPGLITDAVGFILLLPTCRKVIRKYAVEAFKRNVVVVAPGGTAKPSQGKEKDDSVIDVTAKTIDED